MNDKNDLEHQVHITMKSIHERYVAIDQLVDVMLEKHCLLYTSPSPRDRG